MSIESRIERIPDNRYNKKLLFSSGLGYTFDAMDGAVVAFVLAVVAGQWNLTSQQTGVLGSSLLIGFFIGALFAGRLGDAFGRKKVIMWTLVFYCIATVLSAFATNWEQFFWLRILAGIGVGGESAIIAPYLAELIASKYRGKYVGALAGFFSFGYVIAAVLSYLVIPTSDIGWRVTIFITALPIFLVFFWRRSLPESPRWLESQGRVEEANQVMCRIEGEVEKYTGEKLPEPIRTTTQPSGEHKSGSFLELWKKPYRKRTIMLWIVWFVFVFSYYGFFTWIPTLLVKQGLTITKSFGFSILIYVAQIPGYFTGAYLNDKIGRKKVIVLFLGLTAIAAFCMSQSTSIVAIVISAFFMSMFMMGADAGKYAYTPEQYPTHIRATGTGAASSFGRIGGILSPIIIGFLYPIYGFIGVFSLTTAILLIGVIVVWILGTETKEKSLEEINQQVNVDHSEKYKSSTVC